MESKTTVLLKTRADWEEWIELIKTAALAPDIWNLIDPAKARTALTEPVWLSE